MTDQLNPIDGMTVELYDLGQDFLEFDIRDSKIIATRPFQGWMWNGKKVLNHKVVIGVRLELEGTNSPHGSENLVLKYPVIAVKPLI